MPKSTYHELFKVRNQTIQARDSNEIFKNDIEKMLLSKSKFSQSTAWNMAKMRKSPGEGPSSLTAPKSSMLREEQKLLLKRELDLL